MSRRYNNRNNRGRRGGKQSNMGQRELHERKEALKYSEHLRAQGLYAWAEHWRKWSKSPSGTPMPPNYHSRPTQGMTDPRMSIYPKTMIDHRGQEGVEKFISKPSRKPNSIKGIGNIGSGMGPQTQRTKPISELSNRELGEIRDSKGHPTILIKKLEMLRKKYPEIYSKRSNMSLS